MSVNLKTIDLNALEAVLMDLGAKNTSQNIIPGAIVQLATIRKATENAASMVMDAADQMGLIAENANPELAETLMDVSINLYQATGFQDLCGQRLTKIETILEGMQDKLDRLADKIGDDEVKKTKGEVIYDENGFAVDAELLLNGPQLEGEAQSQGDIDALFASMD